MCGVSLLYCIPVILDSRNYSFFFMSWIYLYSYEQTSEFFWDTGNYFEPALYLLLWLVRLLWSNVQCWSSYFKLLLQALTAYKTIWNEFFSFVVCKNQDSQPVWAWELILTLIQEGGSSPEPRTSFNEAFFPSLLCLGTSVTFLHLPWSGSHWSPSPMSFSTQWPYFPWIYSIYFYHFVTFLSVYHFLLELVMGQPSDTVLSIRLAA